MMLEQHAVNILKLLATRKNVLVMGPPAVGKSILMSLVAKKFIGNASPALRPDAQVPIPEVVSQNLEIWMPSSARISNRKTYKMTFHQGTKHRDFVGGIIPQLKGGQTGFRIYQGLLLRANANALIEQGASLVLIDEINRGPAVTIFGDTISSIEADKRLEADDSVGERSMPFYTYSESEEGMQPNYLSSHVYILASMNEADTSVEPLDVAFLRRFEIYRIDSDIEIAKAHLGVDETSVPDEPTEARHIYSVLIRAWKKVNDRISIGRGNQFQIGHGVLMGSPPPTDLPSALSYARQCWQTIDSHVREVFYGNDQAIAHIFNARDDGTYRLKDVAFGDQEISRMHYQKIADENIYKTLRQVADSDDTRT